MRVVILGAAGQLGREVVRDLLARGHTVRAAVRRRPEPALPAPVEIRIADARNKSEICAAISGSDAVVNVIGGGTLRRNEVASSTSSVAVPATQDAGVRRTLPCRPGWLLWTGRCSSTFCVPLFSVIFWLSIAVSRKSLEPACWTGQSCGRLR